MTTRRKLEPLCALLLASEKGCKDARDRPIVGRSAWDSNHKTAHLYGHV